MKEKKKIILIIAIVILVIISGIIIKNNITYAYMTNEQANTIFSGNTLIKSITNYHITTSDGSNYEISLDELNTVCSKGGTVEDNNGTLIQSGRYQEICDIYINLEAPFSFDYTVEYTGGIQTVEIPKSGVYKLEVWGASGGSMWGAGGTGGYSVGYKTFEENDQLYVVCGGTGSNSSGGSGKAGGYNGGGNGGTSYKGNYKGGAGGGGATHIALVTGTLSSIGKTTFDSYGLIVAGGGAGSNYNYTGTGGGTSGGGGSFGKGSDGPSSSSDSGTAWAHGGSGGGGGYTGGSASKMSSNGGTGWIDGVPEFIYKGITYSPSTENGVNSGAGYAKITYITD